MASSSDGTGKGKNPGAPLRVQVDVEKTLGDADLEGLRGVCVWSLPTEPDDPMYKAWKKAGFVYPRWPFLSAGISWKQESDGSRSMVLDYDPLDAVLDGCKKMGIAPLFSFSAMPDELSANPDAEPGEFDGPSHYAPADYAEWEEYIRRVVARVVEKGYPGGYYQIWNEPEDLKYYWKGHPGSKDSLADYIELYVHTARAIKAADPSAKIGGPVSAHWDSVTIAREAKNWGLPQFLRSFAQYCREHPEENVPFDFVDWHDYSFASPVLSDGVDFVDSMLSEVGWPGRPEYLITEWNRHLEYPYNVEESVTPLERAAHAVWNIFREVNSEERRVNRLYWYVLDGGWDVALVDGMPRARLEPSPEVSYSYGLSPTFAVLEMLRDLNRGKHLGVAAQEPLLALATVHQGVVRLMVTNNTDESRTTAIEMENVSGSARKTSCRVQLVDEQHSSDGKGLEQGKETACQIGSGAEPLTVSLDPYSTVLVTLSV